MANFGFDWKAENGVSVYGKTLRQQFEDAIAANPDLKNARRMLYFMSGYFGAPQGPCIDAGVFLIAFTKAIEDGVMTWKEDV